jgi:TupA-like ATPgrasp
VSPSQSFSQRIALRSQLWWERPRWRDGPRAYRQALHRLRELRTFRSRDDPDEAWRCCEFWPRTLLNKWNGREFAARHGCAVPALYWWGSDPRRAPIESLPSRFVVRPVFGTDRRGVLVVAEGRELLRDEPTSKPAVRARLARSRRLRRGRRFLIEEFVRSEDGQARLPTEYKCHTFAGTVAAVQVIVRTGVHEARHRFYTIAWDAWPDPMNVDLPQDSALHDRPVWLERMIELAERLGAELGTYARIDFFAGAGACVFNELSSIPAGGHGFTPYCDEAFGALWTEKCPDAT